jgi:hypothetical protein
MFDLDEPSIVSKRPKPNVMLWHRRVRARVENLQRCWVEPGISALGSSEPVGEGDETLSLWRLQDLITGLVRSSQQIEGSSLLEAILIDDVQLIIGHDEHVIFVREEHCDGAALCSGELHLNHALRWASRQLDDVVLCAKFRRATRNDLLRLLGVTSPEVSSMIEGQLHRDIAGVMNDKRLRFPPTSFE